MNQNVKEIILQKIEQYDKIVISRHLRPDGDAYGSTKGLAALLKNTYPNKKIYVVNEDYSDYLAFLGEEDRLAAEEYADALCIVIDTGTQDRISNRNYALAKELVKIDHHIDDKPYGDVSWVEDFRSSACEMIADFWYTFKDKLKMTKEAATYVYCGMVTDSGRFQYEGVTGETLRLAGALLDYDIDLPWLYANLYVDDFEQFKLKAYVYEHVQRTKNGVASIYIGSDVRKKFGLTLEQASAVIGDLSKIKGCPIWLAFIENEKDESIRVRLRSRYVGVKTLANRYNGGGHEMASGATVYSQEEMRRLIEDADEILKEYKDKHGELL